MFFLKEDSNTFKTVFSDTHSFEAWNLWHCILNCCICETSFFFFTLVLVPVGLNTDILFGLFAIWFESINNSWIIHSAHLNDNVRSFTWKFPLKGALLSGWRVTYMFIFQDSILEVSSTNLLHKHGPKLMFFKFKHNITDRHTPACNQFNQTAHAAQPTKPDRIYQ